jgi:hypothetical protein
MEQWCNTLGISRFLARLYQLNVPFASFAGHAESLGISLPTFAQYSSNWAPNIPLSTCSSLPMRRYMTNRYIGKYASGIHGLHAPTHIAASVRMLPT